MKFILLMILDCIGVFDIIFITSLIVLNGFFQRLMLLKKLNRNAMIVILIFIIIGFGLIIPFISMGFEISEQKAGSNINLEAQEMAYMIFIFPFYWLLGLIQIFAAIKLRKSKRYIED